MPPCPAKAFVRAASVTASRAVSADLRLYSLAGRHGRPDFTCKARTIPGCTQLYHCIADLKSDGTIFFESEAFRSPSSFSVFVKRKLNPRRIADDGWTSVKYCGTVLREFKKRVPPVSGVALGSPAAASTVRDVLQDHLQRLTCLKMHAFAEL